MNRNTYFKHLAMKFMGGTVNVELTPNINVVVDPRVEAEKAAADAKVAAEKIAADARAAAEKIAARSLTANMMLKETINRAFEVNLTEGLRFERRMFHSIFATFDQKEGMQAFVEKRKPNFKNQ